MAERKIVEVEEVKEDKNKGLNIDLSELKKIGAAILAFVASNPELVSKLLKKPAAMLKKIVKGEDVSTTTKKKVNKTIDDSKSGGITSILTSLSSLSGGDSETTNLFGNITSTLKGAESSGIDVGGLLNGVGSLLGSSSKTSKSTKKTSKKSSGSSDVLGGIIKGLFK